jgi:hypothetical protein
MHIVYYTDVLLGSSTLYPPDSHCTNPACPTTKTLKKAEQRQVIIYTLDKGVRPSWEVHLSCEACLTNYQHNFSVKAGIRTYYGGVPDYIKVGDHQYVERRLAAMWISMMLLAWYVNMPLRWLWQAADLLGLGLPQPTVHEYMTWRCHRNKAVILKLVDGNSARSSLLTTFGMPLLSSHSWT